MGDVSIGRSSGRRVAGRARRFGSVRNGSRSFDPVDNLAEHNVVVSHFYPFQRVPNRKKKKFHRQNVEFFFCSFIRLLICIKLKQFDGRSQGRWPGDDFGKIRTQKEIWWPGERLVKKKKKKKVGDDLDGVLSPIAGGVIDPLAARYTSLNKHGITCNRQVPPPVSSVNNNKRSDTIHSTRRFFQ